MSKTLISSGQLFALMFLFIQGTSVIVSLGVEAGRDAWLSILTGTAGGLLLFLLYRYPSSIFPQLTLVGYSRKLLGNLFGTAAGFLYVLYFLYIAARDLRDGVELTNINILEETPRTFIALLLILCVMYVVSLGVEVLARTGQIFLYSLTVAIVMTNSLLFFSGSLELNRLLPILADGWVPVVKSAVSETLVFPFGEMVCFMMFTPFLRKPEQGLPAGMAAIVLSGLLLAYGMVINVAALGIDVTKRTAFPLVNTIANIEIADFVTRLDVLVLLILLINDFFKISIFFYAGLLALSEIFGVPYRKFVFPMGFIVMMWSIVETPMFTQHLEFGKKAIFVVHPLFVAVFPLLLAITAFVYKRRRKFRGLHKTDPQSE
jgi:spore germination protein KB